MSLHDAPPNYALKLSGAPATRLIVGCPAARPQLDACSLCPSKQQSFGRFQLNRGECQ